MKAKLTFTGIIIFLLSCTVQAQTGLFNQVWNKKYQHTSTSNFSNESRKVVVDSASGNIFVLADVTSDLDPSGILTGISYSYVVLTKYDQSGNLINQHLIDVEKHVVNGFDYKSSFGFEIDSIGNLFVGYTSFSFSTDFDVNLAKFDSNLNLIWTYTYNPISYDIGIDMKVSVNGTVYAIINTNNSGSLRCRVIKASGNGTSTTPLYTFTGFADFYTSIALDSIQNIYLAGYRITNNIKKISISSLSNSGSLRWKVLDDFNNPSGNHFARYISMSDDGYLYITGTSEGSIQHGFDVVTMKIFPETGKRIWNNFINNNLSDGGYFVTGFSSGIAYVMWIETNALYVTKILSGTGQTNQTYHYIPVLSTPHLALDGVSISDYKVSENGLLYITGTINATSLNSVPFSSAFIFKMDFSSRGNFRVPNEYIFQGDELVSNRSNSIALDNKNEKIIWLIDQTYDFTTHNSENINTIYLESPGSNIFKNLPFAFQDKKINTENISAFPNPTNDYLTIASKQELKNIFLYELTGKMINEFVGSFSANEINLDLTSYPPGIYIIKTECVSGKTDNLRIIKY